MSHETEKEKTTAAQPEHVHIFCHHCRIGII